MSEQPRKRNGQFAEKWSPAPNATPELPRKNIADSLDAYDASGAEQEAVLSEGLYSVGNSIDQVIEIYRARQERANKQIEENTARLKAISDELDRLSAEREAIAEELRRRRENSLWGKVKKLFK